MQKKQVGSDEMWKIHASFSDPRIMKANMLPIVLYSTYFVTSDGPLWPFSSRKEKKHGTAYRRSNAWNNAGTFYNPDLLWYAKGVGAMMARQLRDPLSWWFSPPSTANT